MAVSCATIALVAPTASASASDGGVQPALLIAGVSALVAVLSFLAGRQRTARDDGAQDARRLAQIEADVRRAHERHEALRLEVLGMLAVHDAQSSRADAEARLAAERDLRLGVEAELKRLQAERGTR